jgi:hypothetical protein
MIRMRATLPSRETIPSNHHHSGGAPGAQRGHSFTLHLIQRDGREGIFLPAATRITRKGRAL